MSSARLIILAESASGGVWEASKYDAMIAAEFFPEVEIWVPDRTPAPKGPVGVQVVPVPFPRRVSDVPAWVSSRIALRGRLHKRDVVHVHGLRAYSMIAPYRRCIVTYHGARRAIEGGVARLCRNSALVLASMSAFHAFSVLPDTPGRWDLAWYPRAELASRARQYRELPRLLWLGRVSSQKRFDLFVDLAEAAISQGIVAGAAVAGSFDPECSGLEERATLLGIELLGVVDDVGGLLSDDWVVCLFSHYEGRPFSVEEAILAELPVIVSDLPGNRLMVGDSKFFADDLCAALRALENLRAPAQRRAAGASLATHLVKVRSAYDYRARLATAYCSLAAE